MNYCNCGICELCSLKRVDNNWGYNFCPNCNVFSCSGCGDYSQKDKDNII